MFNVELCMEWDKSDAVQQRSEFVLLSDFINIDFSLCPQPLLTLFWSEHAAHSSGHLQPMTSSTCNTKGEEWQFFFIIAQPLCFRGKSIIKTRLTAKITAVSSIVLEPANFSQPPRVSWPVQHHLGAICSSSQIPLPFGIGFTWLIHTVNGVSSKQKKEKKETEKGEILCEIAWGAQGFGIVR